MLPATVRDGMRCHEIASRIGADPLIPELTFGGKAVAMDLDDLVVLEDQTFGPEEESLLERLFPETFYVVGSEGNYLTTVNNLDLFQRVVDTIGADTDLDDPQFRDEVAGILEEADELSQEDYDDAAERDLGDGDEDFEEEQEDDWDK